MKNCTLARFLIQLRWTSFALLAAASLLALPLLLSPLYIISEPAFASYWQSLLFSISALVGAEQLSLTTTLGVAVLTAERTMGLVWFSIFTALIFARISERQNQSYLAPIIATYVDDGTRYTPQRAPCCLLEFRLIVYPNPPLIRPQIAVTLHIRNKLGERDNVPLQLMPVQAGQVRYYLTFRTVMPDDYLILADDERLETSRKLPNGVIDFYVSAIDAGSDKTLHIFKEYRLPYEARTGSFADAVELDVDGNISGVIPKNFQKIRNST